MKSLFRTLLFLVLFAGQLAPAEAHTSRNDRHHRRHMRAVRRQRHYNRMLVLEAMGRSRQELRAKQREAHAHRKIETVATAW